MSIVPPTLLVGVAGAGSPALGQVHQRLGRLEDTEHGQIWVRLPRLPR